MEMSFRDRKEGSDIVLEIPFLVVVKSLQRCQDLREPLHEYRIPVAGTYKLPV